MQRSKFRLLITSREIATSLVCDVFLPDNIQAGTRLYLSLPDDPKLCQHFVIESFEWRENLPDDIFVRCATVEYGSQGPDEGKEYRLENGALAASVLKQIRKENPRWEEINF